MINPALERRYADCSELVEAWKSYLEMLTGLVKNTEHEVTPEDEQRFMDVKARIAMLHDSFMDSLRHDQNIGQNMLSIVNRSITLRHLRKLGQADVKKIEIEWHECYLLLNESVSTLAEERERLGEVNELTWKIGKLRERLWVNTRAFFRSIYFKIIVALVILAAVIALPPLFGWSWDNLRTMKGVGEPYSAFRDFTRDSLGMSAPYSSLDKFTQARLAEGKLRSGYQARKQDNTTKDNASVAFASLRINGTAGNTFLSGAEAFSAYQITLPDNRPPAFAYIFYWFEDGKSRDFVREFRTQAGDSTNFMAQSLANQFSIFNDENVLVVLQATFPDLRDQVQREVFQKTPVPVR